MLNVNGRYEDGGGDLAIREMSVQSIGILCGEGGKFLLKFYSHFPENIFKRTRNDVSRELISVFNNSHRKCRPANPSVARTLEHLVGVSS